MCLFISLTILNLSMVKKYSENDISLDYVSVMTKAFYELDVERMCYNDWTLDPEMTGGPREWFRMCTKDPGPLACPIGLGWIVTETRKECIYEE